MKTKIVRRIISIALVIVTLFSYGSVVLAAESDYKDVVNYYPYSSWAVEYGQKYDLIFLENNRRGCTRYEIANLLYCILGLDPTDAGVGFKDTKSLDKKTRERINSVANANIINGYTDGTFKPDNKVTRAEFVAMLDRSGILKNQVGYETVDFSDTKTHWAKDSITFIASLGIVLGKGNNKFCPNDGITPQEVIIILDRIASRNCVTTSQIVTAMTDTFKCKKYTDKEEYIVEVMYSQFDTVQSFMQYAFPFKTDYDYTNWNSLATYDDIHKIMYFMLSYYSEILQSGEEKEMFDRMGKAILEEKRSSGNTYTIRDLIHIINRMEKEGNSYTYGYGYSTSDPVPSLNYTNVNDFTAEDKKIFDRLISNPESTLFVNTTIYFPLDAPVTKYMLNYFAMRLESTYQSYIASYDAAIKLYFGYEFNYELNGSKLPSNYSSYPFVFSDVPNEIYEYPFLYSETANIKTPSQCFGKYANASGKGASNLSDYLNLILNIDYRTINEEEFRREIKRIVYYASNDMISDYVKYVKENEIIIEGIGAAIPGTMFATENYVYIRGIAKFKVVSAKKMENLLFGDLRKELPYDTVYNQTEYEMCLDVRVLRYLYMSGFEIAGYTYKPDCEPLCSCVVDDKNNSSYVFKER